MAVRRLHPEQPPSFAFTEENLAWAEGKIADYPPGKQASAVIPLLWRAQEQHQGWLPEPAIRYVAEMLDMPYIRVYEVATFYTMYQLAPVGKVAHVQVCGTTPCMLRGANDLVKVCKKRIAPNPHELSADERFSWEEVECLGSCANAPMVQIWKDTYEDLNPELFEALLDGFANGNPPAPGSQIGRTASCPEGGPTTLTDPEIYSRRSTFAVAEAPAQQPAAAGGASDSLVAERPDQSDARVVSDEAKPTALDGPRGGTPDDLKRISGVGPKLEVVLNELGIFHFDQIAQWAPDTVAWVDTYLSFKGRIDREDWIAQAKKLANEGSGS